MDIVVTVPKSELANIAKEEVWAKEQGSTDKSGAYCFWKVRCEPKKLERGDRVYFIHDGQIVNYNEFWYYEEDGVFCEVTKRYWEGPLLVMKLPSVPLKKPVRMKGFRGFKYVERIE